MDVPYLPVLSQSWQTVHFKNKIITVKFVVLANIAVICSITNTASPWGPSLHDTLQHILASLNNNRMQKGVFLPNEEQKLYLCLTEKWSATTTTKYIYYIHMPLYINIYGCIKPQPNWSSNEEWMRTLRQKIQSRGFLQHIFKTHFGAAQHSAGTLAATELGPMTTAVTEVTDFFQQRFPDLNNQRCFIFLSTSKDAR